MIRDEPDELGLVFNGICGRVRFRWCAAHISFPCSDILRALVEKEEFAMKNIIFGFLLVLVGVIVSREVINFQDQGISFILIGVISLCLFFLGCYFLIEAAPHFTTTLGLFASLLFVLFVLTFFLGCAAPHTRLVEMPRSAVLNNPEIRAAAPYLFVNRYSATSADVRIYKGHLQKADMIGNVGGRPVIYSDYIDKFRLMNAVGPNDPKLAARMLTPGQPYTALVVVNWGAFGKIYDIYSVSLYPTKDALRTVWTGGRGWDSVYVNDYVEVSGSDQPAYSRLDFTWTIYPNEIVRRALTGGAR